MKKYMYNPFKMWGSYVGVVLYPILIIILEDVFKIEEEFLLAPIYPFLLLARAITGIFTDCFRDTCWGVAIFTFFIGSIIVGFLIGWGIHSLIRKLRRKK